MTEEYDAVVFDLDGTLLRLDVDWATVERELTAALERRGVDTEYDGTPWELLDRAEDAGYYEEIHELIAAHERDGARSSERLPLADDLPDCEGPVGVCSLNAEDACHVALEVHGLTVHVDAVVGRDTVDARKPDPASLLAAIDALDADPGRSLFVGDSESDAVTAERAGVEFRHV